MLEIEIATAPNWAIVASAGAAWIALIISLANAIYAARNFHLNKDKDVRSRPNIELYYAEGYVRFLNRPGRDFAFLVRITNLSESPNSISAGNITLTTRDSARNVQVVQIPLTRKDSTSFLSHEGGEIPVPSIWAPKETKTGWIFFSIPAGALERKELLRQVVELHDTSGNIYNFEPIIIKEYREGMGDG